MEFLFLKYAHIIAFVYWLGGDLGTFVASRHVTRRDLSPEARHTALKIMQACDQGPKMAMPLIFPLGFELASVMGLIQIPIWMLGLVWLAALYWCAVVVVLYMNEGKAFTQRLAKVDFWFRVAVIIAVVAFALHHWAREGIILVSWVAWKLLIFAAMVACGLMIRIQLKPFIPAFVQMMQQGATESGDSAMQRSLNRARPWVWLIWLGLFVNAAFGLHLIG